MQKHIMSLFILALFFVNFNQIIHSQIHGDQKGKLITVTDSIFKLLDKYHYNPEELKSNKYLKIKEEIIIKAKISKSEKEFIDSFNKLWLNGPFSHVRLDFARMPSDKIADYVDKLKTGNDVVSLKFKDDFAILTVNTMTGTDTKEKVQESFNEIIKKKVKYLIIDLRNNRGGTFAGIPMITHIINEPTDIGVFVSRKWWRKNDAPPKLKDVQNKTPWSGWSLKSFWDYVTANDVTRIKIFPQKELFSGKVFILTSRNTASAAEMTIDAMKNSDKVFIIGEKTAGEMLSQKMFDLPSGLQISLPIADYYSFRTGKIEGKGIEPDLSCEPEKALKAAELLIKGVSVKEILKKF